ncbi:polysaccharide biosynthesis/export family protein [Mesobaculum littorinae]|nr:polysaccharide biosynthesis/export family protein [Mesobaculum littorinae]
MRFGGLLSAAGIALFTAGCGDLPRGGPTESDIVGEVTEPGSGIAFYPVTRALIPAVEAWPDLGAERYSGWPAATAGSTGQIIATGDRLEVRIWDSEDNSLLVSPATSQVELGPLVVSPGGSVFVPYVGDVRVAGLSPERARLSIQNRLSSIAPSAQVQAVLVAGEQSSVDLVSGVSQPGSYPLQNRNSSVLSLISRAGGIPPTLRNPRVKLQRGSTLYAISADTLFDNPQADAVLTGGDKIIVEEDERFFLTLGASGTQKTIDFPRDHVTALEAMSMAGGLVASRADPEGILILREYPRTALTAGYQGPREERVIFAIDLTNADGLFAAKNLEIMPGDVIVATESPVTSLRVALGLIGTGFGLVTAAGNVGN